MNLFVEAGQMLNVICVKCQKPMATYHYDKNVGKYVILNYTTPKGMPVEFLKDRYMYGTCPNCGNVNEFIVKD